MGERWISREEWQRMIGHSRSLLAIARQLRRHGGPSEHIWRELGPLNCLIRSDELKVRGIDDRQPSPKGALSHVDE